MPGKLECLQLVSQRMTQQLIYGNGLSAKQSNQTHKCTHGKGKKIEVFSRQIECQFLIVLGFDDQLVSALITVLT